MAPKTKKMDKTPVVAKKATAPPPKKEAKSAVPPSKKQAKSAAAPPKKESKLAASKKNVKSVSSAPKKVDKVAKPSSSVKTPAKSPPQLQKSSSLPSKKAAVAPEAVKLHPKMLKSAGASLNELELRVAHHLADLESSVSELNRLKDLYACGAREICYGKGKKALVLYVPVPLLPKFQAIQVSLVEQLEKRMPGTFVVILAQRRILPKPSRKMKVQPKQRRPDNRTLTAVHKAWLDEIVFPCEIVGKRIRVRQDGTRLLKVHLNEITETDEKVECIRSLYRSITGKNVVFEVPEWSYKDL